MKRFFIIILFLLFTSNIFAQNNEAEDHALIPMEYRDYKFFDNEPDYKLFEDNVVVKGFVFNEPTQKLYVLDDKNNVIVYDYKNALNKDVPKTSYSLPFKVDTRINVIDVSPNGKYLAFMDASGTSLHVVNSNDGSNVALCDLGSKGLPNKTEMKKRYICYLYEYNKHIGNPFRFISDDDIIISGSSKAVEFNIPSGKNKSFSFGKYGKLVKEYINSDGDILGWFYDVIKPEGSNKFWIFDQQMLKYNNGKSIKEINGNPNNDDIHNRNNVGNQDNKYRYGNFRGEKIGNHQYKWYNPYLGAVNDPLYLLSFKDSQACELIQDYKIMFIQYNDRIAFYNYTLTDNEFEKHILLRAININTLEAYDGFISEYPQSKYLDVCRKKMVGFVKDQWNKLSNPNDLSAKHIKDVEDFINKNSNIIPTDAAQNEIANVYKNALNRIGDRDVAQFKSYISTYPKSPYINAAQDKISNAYKLLYADACAVNTSQKYSEYANAYPESPYAKDALDKVKAAQQKEEKARKLEEQRQRERAAEENMYRIAKLGNNKDIDNYIRTYPNGRFIAEVRQLKELANSKSWKLGNSICNCNDDGIIMVTVDQWNEDRSAFKGIVTASPGGLYQGNLLQKGNQLWIEPDGWHKCSESEKQIALEDDRSAEATALMKNKNMPFPRGARVYRVYGSRGFLFSYSYKIVGKVDDWNEDFTKMKLQLISTDGAERIDGESIYEGKYIWISPIGWKQE